MSSNKSIVWFIVFGMACVCTNCAWRAKTLIYYSFDYPTPSRQAGPAIPETLMVYRFLLDRSVPIHSLVVSEPKNGSQSTTSYIWDENPADMITDLILRDLRSSELFERVVDQLSTVRYRYSLEGTLRNLQGLVKGDKGMAILELDATLTDFEAPAGSPKNLMKKSYAIEVPSVDTKPASIMKALNMAVKDVSEQIRRDIRSALRKGRPPEEKSPRADASRLFAFVP